MGSSSTGLRPGRLLLLYGGIVFLLFVVVPAAVYFALDPERLDLNDVGAAQRTGPVRPAERRLHALRNRRAGRRAGRRARGRRHRPVLHLGSDVHRAHRRRLPRAPLRLLRPWLFGSPGHPVHAGSLRPAARASCSTSVHITQPFDLAGLSFGGSVITSVADRYPATRAVAHLHGSGVPHAADAVAARVDAARLELRHRDYRRAAGGRTGSSTTFSIPNGFRTGPTAIACSCSTVASAARGLPTSRPTSTADQRDEVQRVGRARRPVLVVWGKQDPNVPVRVERALMQPDAVRAAGGRRRRRATCRSGSSRTSCSRR